MTRITKASSLARELDAVAAIECDITFASEKRHWKWCPAAMGMLIGAVGKALSRDPDFLLLCRTSHAHLEHFEIGYEVQ